MKLRTISSLFALAVLSASASYAQLTYSNEGSTAFGGDERSNAGDQVILGNLGSLSTFTLASLPGLTFTDVSGTVTPADFGVGNNGSFDVSAEVAFVYRSAADLDTLITFGNGNAGDASIIYSSDNAAGLLNTTKIGGTGSTSSALNQIEFQWNDHVTDQESQLADTNGVKIFESTDDPNYNYFVFGNEDRKGNLDADFNDFNFLVRINTSEVGFTPVPESSTYGMVAAAGLLVLVATRRFKRKAA
jgi:hypothetical protein